MKIANTKDFRIASTAARTWDGFPAKGAALADADPEPEGARARRSTRPGSHARTQPKPGDGRAHLGWVPMKETATCATTKNINVVAIFKIS